MASKKGAALGYQHLDTGELRIYAASASNNKGHDLRLGTDFAWRSPRGKKEINQSEVRLCFDNRVARLESEQPCLQRNGIDAS